MNPDIHVFYAGMLVESMRVEDFALYRTACGPEIYNGAYMYMGQPKYSRHERGWYRIDGTPCLLEDVPKDIRALLMIIT